MRIARTHQGKKQQAQAALELVQQQVRYIFVGLDGGNLKPATAEETWQRRYGDCKGKTALLLTLLRELGIEAEGVLVNNSGSDDALDTRLPSPVFFDHVLVRANIDGTTYWLDGTLPAVIEVSEKPLIPYRWILPLSDKGSNLVAVRPETFRLPQEMGLYEIDARAGFEQPARIIDTNVKRGVAGLTEYLQLSTVPPQQLKAAFQNAMGGNGQWNEIDDVVYHYDRTTRASILKVIGSGPVDWDDKKNGRYDLALPGGGFSPPERRQRASGDDQAAPFYNEPDYSCYATTVRLPADTDLDNWGFNTTFDTTIYGRLYYRMIERRDDHTIRMVRGSRIEQSELSPEMVSRDNDRLEKFDNSKAIISYDPNSVMTPWGNLSSVPATYEIDWTSPSAPCLPRDVLIAEEVAM